MRLKVAEVLVDDGDGVAPLERVSDAGNQIVTQHKDLWSIAVYADASIRPGEGSDLQGTRKVDVLLGVLKEEMDLRLVRWDGEPVRSLQELAVHTVGERCSLDDEQRSQLLQLVPAALGATNTFDALLKATWRAAAKAGMTSGGRPPSDL